jgi:hypothetical protein
VRDNQPKHRQFRREGRKLDRQKASRAGLPSILIVCEGRETEPNYLSGLCDAHGINRANVTIVAGDSQTDPAALVRKARKRFAEDRDFDRVFVVCDDGATLAVALREAAKPMKHVSGPAVPVEVIVSRPCFEFWLLLHFEYSARPFGTAAEVIGILEKHLPDYDKADRRIFEQVQPGLDLAGIHVNRLKAGLAAQQATIPDTDMPVLVEALWGLRRTYDR